MKHAILGASSSKRWMTCTPSARLEQTLALRHPELNRSSAQADEGTWAHELSELILRKQVLGEDTDEQVLALQSNKWWNKENQGAIFNYVAYVRNQFIAGEDSLFLEQRCDFSTWVPEGFGTGDVVITGPRGIHVIDLKFGKGVPVSPFGNTQMRLYALGFLARPEFRDLPSSTKILLTIAQPRLDAFGTDETTAGELLDWAENTLVPLAAAAWAGEGEFVVGDHCRFCKAKSTCTARAKQTIQGAVADFPDAPALTDSDVLTLIERINSITKLLEDYKEYSLELVKMQSLPTGWKTQATSKHRAFNDPAKVAEILKTQQFGDEVYEPAELKSPAKIEKILGKSYFDQLLGQLTFKPEGTPRIIRNDAQSDFE